VANDTKTYSRRKEELGLVSRVELRLEVKLG